MSNNEKILYTFVALSVSIYIFESYIPRPLPWIKLGLSNIIILILVYFYPLSFVLKVVLLRILIGSFIVGTFFTPTFFLSLFAGLLSTISMFLFKEILNKFISPIGVSIIGSEIHITAQLLFVYLFIIKDKIIFKLYPFLILFSLVTGSIIGYLGKKVITRLNDYY